MSNPKDHLRSAEQYAWACRSELYAASEESADPARVALLGSLAELLRTAHRAIQAVAEGRVPLTAPVALAPELPPEPNTSPELQLEEITGVHFMAGVGEQPDDDEDLERQVLRVVRSQP